MWVLHDCGIEENLTEFGALDHFFAKRVLKEAYTDARAGFLCRLMQETRSGNLCIFEKNPPQLPEEVAQNSSGDAPIIRDGDRFYIQKNWVYETEILTHLKRLKKEIPPPICNEERFEKELDKANLQPKQKSAALSFLKESVTVLCGGPGTGKTYTVAAFVRSLIKEKQKKLKIYLTAPTGKAASHLKTVIGLSDLNAMTLHRLLGIQPGIHTKSSIIDADIVIIDEASMLDVPILAKTFASIPNGTRLILMGDPDQLPPIEAGSLFKEMAKLFGVQLEKSMRVEDFTLHTLAESINRGASIDSSFFVNIPFDANLTTELYQRIDPEISEKKPDPKIALEKINQFRVLDALRLGPFGTDVLNKTLLFEMKTRTMPNSWWAIPIMITKNTPKLDLYNGSCGILIGKAKKGLDLGDSIAYFPQEIPYRDLPQFEISFCLSIHKAQGSEFESVLALFPQGSENFGREALYTAVTRAKRNVGILSESNVIKLMLSKRSERSSGFSIRF